MILGLGWKRMLKGCQSFRGPRLPTKALRCLLPNGGCGLYLPMEQREIGLCCVGMFSVSISDITHLIQLEYYHHTSSYDNTATDVETFRLEPRRI